MSCARCSTAVISISVPGSGGSSALGTSRAVRLARSVIALAAIRKSQAANGTPRHSKRERLAIPEPVAIMHAASDEGINPCEVYLVEIPEAAWIFLRSFDQEAIICLRLLPSLPLFARPS